MQLTLSGNRPLILVREPVLPLEAATKNYVDVNISIHAQNTNLHLTTEEKQLLQNLVIQNTNSEYLSGLTGNIQAQLDSKVSKAGDTMTGPLTLSGDPTQNLHAATKQYVDNSITAHASNLDIHVTPEQNALLDALTVTATEINRLAGVTSNVQTQLDSKLPLAGGTLTGSLILKGDPTQPLEAATKQYVDTTVNTHASDGSLHVTPEQNALLDSLTVTATEINRLAGVTSNIQDQLNAKFDKTGGVVSGNITLDTGYTIYVAKQPEAANEVANKAYVDSKVNSKNWRDPVTDVNLVATKLSTPPATPVAYDVYIIGSNPTGAWSGKAGYATYWNGSQWVFLQNRPVQAGDRFGVALYTSTSVTDTTLSSYVGKIVTISDATPGAIQVTPDADPTSGTSVLVFDADSRYFGVTFSYSDEGTWVITNTSVNINAGAGLSLSGNTLNVNIGSGLINNSDNIDVNLNPAGGLNVNTSNQLEIKLADSTLVKSTSGLAIAPTVISDINDKVSKTSNSTVTGSVTFNVGSNLYINYSVSDNYHAVNKVYVDTNVTNLQGQITSLQSTVNTLNTDPVTKTYVDNGLATKVSKAGDTMTGPLTLSGDPTQNLHAATKQYVDTSISTHAANSSIHITAEQNALLDALTVSATEINRLAGVTSNVQTQLDDKLSLSGGTLSGRLYLFDDPIQDYEAATKNYVDNVLNNHVVNDSIHITPDQNALLDALTVNATEINRLAGVTSNVQSQLNAKVNKAGDTLTGFLTLHADPTDNLHAATKKYVDNAIGALSGATTADLSTKVSKSGDTMTGPLTLSGDPTQNLHAATKQYVDASDTALTNQINTVNTNLQNQITTLQSTVDTLNSDPVTKTYVDTGLAGKVNKSGGMMTGYLTLHADPQNDMHAATKRYVDSVAQGLVVKASVRLATTANLDATYNNTSPATLTGDTNGALVVDGKNVNPGDRILVKNQTNKVENGAYVVQQTGSASAPFILKRVELADESDEIPRSYYFVEDGVVNKGTGWILLVDNPVTFTLGTDNIYVCQFSGQGSILAGDGLMMNGNVINVVSQNSSRIVVNSDSIDLATTGVTPGTYTKVTVDGYGRVLSATNPNTLVGYGITDAQPLNSNLTSLSNLTTSGIVVRDSNNEFVTRNIAVNGVGLSITNGSGAQSGNITITSNATYAIAPNTIVSRDANGNFSANVITANLNGNAATATKLETSRNFNVTGDVSTASAVAFDGTQNVTLNVELTTTGVTPGAYTKVTVDEKGRIILGSNPTTVAEYGIVDAATIDYVNNKIAELEAKLMELYTYINAKGI